MGNGNSATNEGNVDPGTGPVDSLKELVLQAGLELLDLHGLTLTFDTISYARVFDHLREEYGVTVTRGSVHERIWASQDDFRRDVLAESVAYFPTSSINDVVLNREFPTGSLSEFAMDLGVRALPEVVRSSMSGRFQSVKALASWFDDPLATETLHSLLSKRADTAIAKARLEFPIIIARLGLRPRADLGLSEAYTAGMCCGVLAVLIEGGLLNYHAGSHAIAAPVEFQPTGEGDTKWSALSVGIKSVLEFFYEPDTVQKETPELVPPSGAPKIPNVEPHTLSSSSRRPRTQLRELVLTAAVELLLRDGAGLKPELLNYATVFAHIRATRGVNVYRSSVHRRIWANNDEYRYEVLKQSLKETASPLRDVSRAIVQGQPVLRSDSVVDRQQSAHDVFRNGSMSLPGASARAVSYRRLVQIKAALIDQDDADGRGALRAAIVEAEHQRMEGNKVELTTLVLDHGFRAKPETGLTEAETIELFEILTMATAAGVIFNEVAGVSLATGEVFLPHPSGNGEREIWSPLGIAIRSYFHQLYEEIP